MTDAKDLSAEDKAKADKIEAAMKAFREGAEAELDALGVEHKFQMKGSCEDKSGNETSVLRVNLDADGFLGLYMKLGLPAAFSSIKGDVEIDDEKIAAYFSFMANIDLSKGSNLSAIGISSLNKARETVKAFFMLRLAADS